MKRALVYKKTYGDCDVSVYHLAEHAALVYEMDGYLPESEADLFIDDLLDATRKARPGVMIADPRKMKVLNEPFQAKVRLRFWPAIADLGVKRNPAIAPEGVITSKSVRRMVATAGETVHGSHGNRVEIAMFATLEECLVWASAR
jgi:hypothetical protein